MRTPDSFIEGEAEFIIPGIPSPCKTWYRIYGNLERNPHRPVIAAHGGPGLTCDYILPIAALTTDYDIPVVFYDQIGSGRSTLLPEKRGDGAFWTDDLFMAEVENLIEYLGIQDDFDVLGHSWGGMMLSRFVASRQPKGLKHLVIADAPARMADYMESINEVRASLPVEMQDRLKKMEDEGAVGSTEYTTFVMANFYAQFACPEGRLPDGLAASFEWVKKDPTVHMSISGTGGDFVCNGRFKDWSVVGTGELGRINVPALLIHGEKDIANSHCVLPYFLEIPKVRWYTVPGASHVPYMEQTKVFAGVVADFLTNV